MSEPFWRGAAEDKAMQDEHGFLWRAILNTIDIDLTGRRVLDAGCNRGGFLRLPRLYDLDEVVEVFESAGFEVSVARLQMWFVPVSARRGGHEHRRGLTDWLDYYERDKVLFRFTRPPQR
ncbi:MAG: hypothetical protein ACRD0R_12435 [Acidimicrobiales bacterium]